MQLHTLSSQKTNRAQRVARGGKRGTYSGRGQKGQKSRSGRRIRPAMRDLIIRIPKKRGFHNKPKAASALVLQLSDLKKMEGVVDREALKKAKMIPQRHLGLIKILSAGEAPAGLTIRGLSVSAVAKKKIEEAKGKVE